LAQVGQYIGARADGADSGAGHQGRHDLRLKQHPGWNVGQLLDGTFRWTTPGGRTYISEPTRYPIYA